jgi:small subunit ribosomal protein S8
VTYPVLKNQVGKFMDRIGDMLTIIRNGQAAEKKSVFVPFSKVKFEIAKVLKEKGFIEKVIKTSRGGARKMELVLKYDNEGVPKISSIKRISKPGGRVYASSQKIKYVKQGYGFAIISTSRGMMTDKEARQKKIGGELICEVW